MKVRCELCPTECVLRNYEVGACRVRINKGGVLYSLVYGRPCAVAIDPVEKKPFYHFLPGSRTFSIATAGCVLGCKFCQNWQISQANPEDTENIVLMPDDVVRRAIFYGTQVITYTYTEPTVFYEYMFDTSMIARRYSVKNTMHTCGYINKKPLRELAKYLDAVDVDLKAFTEDFYNRICGGRLGPVLNTLLILKEESVWLEITNLIIPTLNDDMKEIKKMCVWIRDNLGNSVPLHFSRFFPQYRLKNLPPTPFDTLKKAREVAMETGIKYVYIGNIRSDAENTFCPYCKRLVIKREGYTVRENNIINSRCRFGRNLIPGVWN